MTLRTLIISGGGQSDATIKSLAQTKIEEILTTRGDLLTRDASGAARLAIDTSGQVLESDGTDPGWRGRSAVILKQDSATTFPHTANTTIDDWNNEIYDPDDWHDPLLNDHRVTVPTGLDDLYQVAINIRLTTPNGDGTSTLKILLNNAERSGMQGGAHQYGPLRSYCALVADLAAADYLHGTGQQFVSPGQQNVTSEIAFGHFTVFRVART